jgi:pimeloyl-ACP methyl ester carboxylesterase
MTTTASQYESRITVQGAEVQMFSSGSGPPLLFLHGAGGSPGWQPYLDNLAQNYTVYAPSQAGFDGTPRPPWISTITDLAHFNQAMVHELGLQDYVLVGFSMGGWVAAEMAAMDHHDLKGLVLVDAAGIKPVHGEIAEVFMVSAQTRAGQRFYDVSQVPDVEQQYWTRELSPEEALADHSNREMSSRLCWKPYLHNPSLPHYLGKVDTPTLIIWGKQDAVVPVECAHLYANALPNATVREIDRCGHFPLAEKPAEFNQVINEFLSGLG